jgi:ferritin-like metal-binding protein YciE
MTDGFQTAIDGLKKEVERLEKIVARFEKSNSMHHDSVLKLIHSIEKHIEMFEAPSKRKASVKPNLRLVRSTPQKTDFPVRGRPL